MTGVWGGSIRLILVILVPGLPPAPPATRYLLMEGWYSCWQQGLGWEPEWSIHGTGEWLRWNPPDDETSEKV